MDHYNSYLIILQIRGDRGWTLQNLHFTPYLSNEKKKKKKKKKKLLHSILGLPLVHYVYYNLKYTKHENIN